MITALMYLLFLVCICFSFFFFWRASSNLRDSFMMVFAQNSSIFHWAVHQPIVFFPGVKSHEAIQTAHWRTMA